MVRDILAEGSNCTQDSDCRRLAVSLLQVARGVPCRDFQQYALEKRKRDLKSAATMSASSELSRRTLATYRSLLRARRVAFEGDALALNGASDTWLACDLCMPYVLLLLFPCAFWLKRR